MKHLTTIRYIDTVARVGSIRKAADVLAITSTALNRRILAIEEELGVPIFERLPRGVRLNSAGEILVHHIRNQLSDMERVRSQIADLSGIRRGHVSIACSQALLPYFLPQQIATYRKEHPAVTFGVYLRDRAAAEQALVDHTADLALVFEPVRLAEFQTILTVRQQVYGVMSDSHPLASHETLRLRDCLQHPIALPTNPYGVRYLLELALVDSPIVLNPVIESDSFEFLRNHTQAEGVISFQIPIGLPMEDIPKGSVARPIDLRDVPTGLIYIGQLRGRTLPVAVARFADQITKSLQLRYE
ncbi:LysR family transcriptional regulator [Sneathiella sp. CAU 1612]|uniref:LysR family transcriptional regulator n=1 Tax=Sneathiella sedimenti TaxID=2816034 RepID=A0ABS3F3Q3_9PROT|nr:LysR family transcriptional regulator [Sneathiella sedimenti]MBO0333140.1 LysR family transcriptional regulator [Sneathiella sedimenti]